MSAKDSVRGNKSALLRILCGDYRLILNKVYEKKIITQREYNNLKRINKEDVEGHVDALLDTIISKGEVTCQAFLKLLQTDEEINSTYPELKNMQMNTCDATDGASKPEGPAEAQAVMGETCKLIKERTGDSKCLNPGPSNCEATVATIEAPHCSHSKFVLENVDFTTM
ncbi:caspase-8-like [Scomber scombrus]|uniref:Caspase-8-like n=1 Tax=Scomber scombrus TaxID=13677 RepID=A0AAV1QM78_SCOSC